MTSIIRSFAKKGDGDTYIHASLYYVDNDDNNAYINKI